MATIRDYKTPYRNIVRIVPASLVGRPFVFEYRSMAMGGEKFVASYDGEEMVNCKFSVNAEGAEDKSVVIVPMNYIKVPPTTGALVKRTFDGNIVEVETMMPCEGGDYESFAGQAGAASHDAVVSLQRDVDEISGAKPETDTAQTPEVDSHEEVKNFLEGYDNTQKLKDVMPKAMTDEEYQAVRDLIK